MEREQLEHLIRAASAIVDNSDLVVVGSQSILGQFPDAPATLKMSMEADIYVRDHPELGDLIDGSIGELSTFQDTFGYYAQGVDAKTAVLPRGWERRLTKVSVPGAEYAVGHCIDVHDLALAKYVANRQKDRRFNMELVRHRMVDPQVLWSLADMLPADKNGLDHDRVNRVRSAIKLDAGAVLGTWEPTIHGVDERPTISPKDDGTPEP
jgi:hypothetical protein